MAKKNFTITTVATAPSPATTGTSLIVASGDGALFAVNEPAIIFPVNDQPLVANAEIVMVTNVSTDTLTITRTQESTSARTIVAGDIIIQGITAKDWNDLVTLVSGKITAFADPNADRIVFWDDSAGAFAALTASTGLTLSGTNLTVRAASETATGIVERATDTEFTNGTDTTRFINAKQAASISQTMTNKTFTSPVLNTGVSGTAVLDEDNMASDSATKLATQQSIKAYVDSGTTTLTNKTIDGDNNTVQDLPYSAIKSTSRSGLDTKIITGTPNTTNLGLVQWNSDGDAVDSLIKPSAIETGWIDVSETWTYASATTITVPSGATSKYQKGDKIKITNNSATKYFYIVSVADTVLTVTGGSDYTVHDSAITSPYFSKIENPQGFPQYFAWTPTVSGSGSMTYGSVTISGARFCLKGKTCLWYFNATGTIGGTTNSYMTHTVPIAGSSSVSNYAHIGQGDIYNDGSAINQVVCSVWNASSRTSTFVYKNATNAFTAGSGRQLSLKGDYEIA